MTHRAIALGLLLVLVICGLGYFSGHVADLPSMINGAMPLIVFGALLLLALGVNPLLVRLGLRGLRANELAVIVAMGVIVSGFTGHTYLRYLGAIVTVPAHLNQTQVSWQATRVMAYVPGHVGLLPEGHLRSPTGLAQRVVAEREAETAAGRLWRLADEAGRWTWEQAAAPDARDAAWRERVVAQVNRTLRDERFAGDRAEADEPAVAAGRRWLQAELPALFVAPPRGGGVLLHDGRYDPALMDPMLVGEPGAGPPSPARVPWRAWAPVLTLWGGLMLVLVLAVICLSIIVRPQWANHERLAFPIVRFAEFLAARDPERTLPRVAYAPPFWLGLTAILLLHVVNGLHAWWPKLPHVPLMLDLGGLRTLFPDASRVWQSTGVFEPAIVPTVIAFAFFLPRSISLTFGITNVVYIAAAAQLIARGIDISGGSSRASFAGLVNFGGMLALIGMVIYTGRRYYTRVALGALLPGARVEGATPAAVWACRFAVVLVAVAVLLLVQSGLSPAFAVMGVGLVLMLWIVTARIVCETGLLRMGSSIVPAAILTAFFGYDGVGPTNLIVLVILSVLFAVDLWESPMTYAITGVELTKRTGVAERTTGPALAITAALGLVVAIVATLAVQHHFGVVGRLDPAETGRVWWSVGGAAQAATELAATNQLLAATDASDLQRLASFEFSPWTLGWTGTGLVLFTLCAAARLRLPWWPIHPVLFVLIGNWGLQTFGFSFLLGWVVKSAVVGLGGARAYHRLLPLMAGIIAGGLAGALFWLIVGWVYFLRTGHAPPSYLAL